MTLRATRFPPGIPGVIRIVFAAWIKAMNSDDAEYVRRCLLQNLGDLLDFIPSCGAGVQLSKRLSFNRKVISAVGTNRESIKTNHLNY